MIQPERIRLLNQEASRSGDYVLYWMQQSQREKYNHALEYALGRANEFRLPLLVVFALTTDFPEANTRHYAFMLQGLAETSRALARRQIKFVLQQGRPQDIIPSLGARAALVVTDCGYLRIQRLWRRDVARLLGCPLVQVESDVIVPVQTASVKEEYSAGTFRPRLKRQLAHFLLPVKRQPVGIPSLNLNVPSLELEDTERLLSSLGVDDSVKPVTWIRGGGKAATKRLKLFIKEKLPQYDAIRNHPEAGCQSYLSPFLHFGQISPLEIALEVLRTGGGEGFLEELIVRRELSMNFTYYNPDYDTFACLPRWAAGTLNAHNHDKREILYTRRQLEAAATYDPYWNAAQQELLASGRMHNYMRMYWGKKILQWSRSPLGAFNTALYLNNKYALDGRDPNSFTGVAWCFGKHDRAWGERSVFGKVRYMDAGGLKRKFKMEGYLVAVEKIMLNSPFFKNQYPF